MKWVQPWTINNGKWWYPPDLEKPAGLEVSTLCLR